MRRGLIAVLASMCVLFGALPAQASAKTDAENKIFAKINNYRVANSRGTLVQHPAILTQVRAHAKWLYEHHYGPNHPEIAHNGFNDRALAIQAADAGIGQMCENVAMASGYTEWSRAASVLFRLWKKSTSGHNECMLSTLGAWNAESAAVGVYKKGSSWYAVFIAADDSTP